ncbi:MAG: preprotein translocase subunit YajC [Alphaproteobacteria bacterium]|nr:preprotein translocase subunit YajC [Alphaproteobacteria bacterium]|tara:strand:- start:169 stop:594 length:426 start_codon:yes stop_codon:yes gene_type:complete
MLIAKAHAQAVEMSGDIPASAAIPDAPSATEAFLWNMGLVAVLVLMFYVLLIRPQQKRIREHAEMLQGLKKGDKVVTAGGLVGKISKIKDGEDEVEVDLGNSMTVTVVRSMLQGHESVLMNSKPANDSKKDDKKDFTKDKK